MLHQVAQFCLRHFEATPDRNLTADEVLDWDHDGAGEAEFWPAGDHPGVASVFDRKSAVTGSELEALDDLLRQLGQDDTEIFLRIRYAVHDRGLDLAGLTAAEVEDAPLYLYRGTNFCDLYQEAGYDLFEAYYPDLYALWEKTPCDGLHFCQRRFENRVKPPERKPCGRLGSKNAVGGMLRRRWCLV
jgi:hypothetical protein